MKKTVILAFSGGLDTSFCALYLQKQGYTVLTLTVNTGGFTKKDIKLFLYSHEKKVFFAIKQVNLTIHIL